MGNTAPIGLCEGPSPEKDWLESRVRRKPPQEDKERLLSEYFATALHYQIVARYSAAAAFLPVVGNLAHHAIEFYLKGALAAQLDETERRKIGHNLRRLWRLYKSRKNNPALDKFDQTIRDINKFERI